MIWSRSVLLPGPVHPYSFVAHLEGNGSSTNARLAYQQTYRLERSVSLVSLH